MTPDEFNEAFPQPVGKKKKKPVKLHTEVSNAWKVRFEQSYATKYPAAYKHDGMVKGMFPSVGTANGLTKAIISFVNWNGYRATRISSSGRVVDHATAAVGGGTINVKKFIPGTTRKGTADVSATIAGRACMFEVKVGKDRPSDYQLKEQFMERNAGGVYEFIHSMDEFVEIYDKILNHTL